jgi:SAM-dependent methyltransferase
MKLVDHLLERTAIYSLWQAPFAAAKVAPMLAHNDLRQVRRVLDAGCGPGTNTHLFPDADYLGIDINPRYIQAARRKQRRQFVIADVSTYKDDENKLFDFILINSFLHHLDVSSTRQVLSRLRTLLTEDGHMHIMELVSPGGHSVAQLLADWDRGRHARPLGEWRDILGEYLDVVVFQPYALKALGTTLWNMVYCKGRAKP